MSVQFERNADLELPEDHDIADLQSTLTVLYGTDCTDSILQQLGERDQTVTIAFTHSLLPYLTRNAGGANLQIDMQLSVAAGLVKYLVHRDGVQSAAIDGRAREIVKAVTWPASFRQEIYEHLFDRSNLRILGYAVAEHPAA